MRVRGRSAPFGNISPAIYEEEVFAGRREVEHGSEASFEPSRQKGYEHAAVVEGTRAAAFSGLCVSKFLHGL